MQEEAMIKLEKKAAKNKICLLLLNDDDNVFVALSSIEIGPALASGNTLVDVRSAVTLGHKIARVSIQAGEKIIKYGVSIGSATQDITVGEHVHTRNVKSDYTATHLLDETARGGIIDA